MIRVPAPRRCAGKFLGDAFRVALAVAVLAAPVRARADVLAGWDFSTLPGGTNNFGPSPFSATVGGANLTVGGLTRGNGVGTDGSGAVSAWGGNAWNGPATLADAIDRGDFVTFTMTPAAGYVMSLSGFDPYNVRRSSSGPTTGQWQFQVGSGDFIDIGSAITWGSVTTGAGNLQSAIDLTGFESLQNVSGGTAVTFRLVNYGATTSGGTWYLNSTVSGTGLDFVLNGTVLQGGVGGDLFWNATGWVTAAGVGGTGTWSDGTGDWDPTNTANFGGDAGVVTIAGTASAEQGLSFLTDGYTVEGGQLSLTGPTNQLSVNAALSATISSVLAGTSGFVKSGAGTLVLDGANTVSGGVTLAGGVLAIADAAALGDPANTVAFSGGALRTTTSLDLGGRGLSGGGVLDIAAGTTLTAGGSVNLTSLTLAGGGDLTFTGGSPAVTGNIATTFTSGTSTISGAIDVGAVPRTVTVATGGTLVLADQVTAAGEGTNALVKIGGGTLVLESEANAITLHRFSLGRSGTNPATDFGGTVRVATAGALGTNVPFLNWGTLEATEPLEFEQSVSIGGQPGAPTRFAGESMLFTSEESFVFFGPGPKALVVDNDATILSGISGTSSSITIGGTGTLRILGDAGFVTSPVTLTDRVTLSLENDGFFPQFSGIIRSNITVGGSATLAGNGRVGFDGFDYVGTLRVADGGTLSPGLSPGTLSAGSTTFEGGGNFNLQVVSAVGTPGSGWDLLAVTGSLAVAATAENPFNVNLWSLSGIDPDVSGPVADFDNQQGYSWTFVTTTAGISGFAANKFVVNTNGINGTGGFANDLSGGSFAIAPTGNNLAVVFTPFIEGATLDWYGDGVTAGGPGTWTSLGQNWSPDGGATIGTWDPDRTAVFGGASGGGVTIQEAGITAAGLQVQENGYVFGGGGLTLAAGGAGPRISVAAGTSVEMESGFSATERVTFEGGGRFVLSGNGSFAGGASVADGVLQVGNGAAGSLTGNVAIETGSTLAFDPGETAAYAGTISGAGTVVKQGAGSQRLAGFSDYTGGTRLEEGGLVAGTGSAFGSGAVTALDGAVLVEQGVTMGNAIVVGEPGSAPVPTLIAGWDFQTTSTGGTALVASPNTPQVVVANFGSGTLYLNGSNGSSTWASSASNPELTAFQGTTVNAGDGFSTVTTGAAALALANSSANGKSAIFTVDMSGYELLDVTYASQRSTSGFTSQFWEASIDGATWVPVTTLTNTGTTFAITGTARLPTVTSLSNAQTAFLRLTVDGATSATGNNRFDNFQFVGTAAPTPTGSVVLGTEATAGTATFTGNVSLNQPVSLSAAAGGTAEFSGVISDATGINAVTKIGAGTVVLAGANTYRGATAVAAGTLLVTGNSGSSGFTVNAATLGGTGTVGSLALTTDATLAPGVAGIGTLTAGATTFGGGAAFDWQLQNATGAAGSGWDLLVLDSLNVTATAESPFTVNLWTVAFGNTSGAAANFDPLQTYRWSFARLADGGSGQVNWGGADRFLVNAGPTASTGGFANDTQGGTFSVALSSLGNGLDIVFTPNAAASQLIWYGDDESAGGKGDWANLNINWFDTSTEQLTQWNAARTAVFGTVGGEVTIAPAGIVAANGIVFEANNYVLGGGDLTLGGGSLLANTITVDAEVSTTIAAVVAGSAGLTKSGGGTLVLTNDATVSGGAVVSEGTLQLGDGGTAGSLPGDVAVGGAATLAVNRSDEVTISGGISGAGALSKAGTGTLRLTGSSSYAGGTTVAEGLVVVGDGTTSGAIAPTGSLTLAPEAVLAFDRSDTITFDGSVAGAGTLAQIGTGTLTLSRSGTANAYGPDFTLRIADGTVDLFRNNGTLVGILGEGNAVELAGGTLQLRSDGGPETQLTGPTIDIQADSTLAIFRTGTTPNNHSSTMTTPLTVANDARLAFEFRGAITGTFSGRTTYVSPVTLASNATFAVENVAGGGGEVIFSGAVGDAGAGHGLTFAGPQRLTLTSTANTYSGATIIAAGTLALGASARIASSPLIAVAGGATFDVTAQTAGYAVAANQTLAGNGTVAGSVTIGTDATLSPGASPGTLTITQNAVWGAGGNYNWQMHDAAGTAGSATGWDLVNVGGTLDIAATSASRYAINLWSLSGVAPDQSGPALNFDATQQGAWTIASAAGGITNFATDKFTINTAARNGTDGFVIDPGLGVFSLQLSGSTDLQLVYTPGSGPAPTELVWYGDGVNRGGSGTWTTTGATWWNGSTVQAWDPSATAVFDTQGGTVTVGAGITAERGLSVAADGYSLTGSTIALVGATAADNVVDVVGSAVALVESSLSGTAGLKKTGAGGLVLAGANAYGGGTTVEAGTLAVGGGGETGSIVGNVVVADGATLAFDRADALTFAGHVSGAGQVQQLGTGVLTLTGASTHTGDTTVFSGTLELAAGDAVSASAVVIASGATLRLSPGLEALLAELVFDGGRLDVDTGRVIVATGLSAAEVVAEILLGRGEFGLWDGTSGIMSSYAAAEVAALQPRGIGWLDHGDGSFTIAFAAPGDTNLDGLVDVQDAINFLSGNKYDTFQLASWIEGDFNYDGFVDVQDAIEFLSTGLYDAGPYIPDETLTGFGGYADPGMLRMAAVPEPGTAWLAGIAACIGIAARLRRRTRDRERS